MPSGTKWGGPRLKSIAAQKYQKSKSATLSSAVGVKARTGELLERFLEKTTPPTFQRIVPREGLHTV